MKQLVLAGGGHAHVHVLAALAERRFAVTDVVLVSPYSRQIYSGMLPGWLAGFYAIEECALALDTLAQRAGAKFVQAACDGLDLRARQLLCRDGDKIPFDYISIDTGPVADSARLPGAAEHALPIRPLEGFVAAWPGVVERARRQGTIELALVGDGAAAVELAFAIEARLSAEKLRAFKVTLIGGESLPLPGFPASLRRQAASRLARRGIVHCGGRRAVAVEREHVLLEDGRSLAADLALLASGSAAPRWPADSGLATDDGGFIRVNRMLQSVSHPFVFSAGDVAAYADARPKSGVFAVRAGPPLAANLRAICQGQALKPWRPQRRALYLLSTGDGQALAAWGGLSASGRWLWRWKDRIDRRFVAQFSPVMMDGRRTAGAG